MLIIFCQYLLNLGSFIIIQKIFRSQGHKNMEKQSNFMFLNYKISCQQQLGGSFGNVYNAVDLKTNDEVAVKMIFIEQTPELIEQIEAKQISVLKKITHDNIVKIYDNGYKDKGKYYYIVMEKCQSDLQKLINSLKKKNLQLTQDQSLFLVFQILRAFKMLYEKNILHRDLKPPNVFIKDGVVKVGDFGFSKEYLYRKNDTRTPYGKTRYMSLELSQEEKYSQKADVWALGCTFYELLSGQLPWKGIGQPAMIKMLKSYQKQGKKISIERKDISKQTIEFLNACLTINQLDRPSWGQLFSQGGYFPKFFSKQQQINKKTADYKKRINQLLGLKRSSNQKPIEKLPESSFDPASKKEQIISQPESQSNDLESQVKQPKSAESGQQPQNEKQQEPSNSQQLQLQLQPKPTEIKQLKPHQNYLQSMCKTQDEINNRHGVTQTKNGIDYYRLRHWYIEIKMDDFIQFDWNHLAIIDLVSCSIDDAGWSKFSHNAHSFPNLHTIYIDLNNISKVTADQLYSFTSLRYIQFYAGSTITNPLSVDSVKALQQFNAKNNPKKWAVANQNDQDRYQKWLYNNK